MGYSPNLIPADATDVDVGSINATTAGTSILIPSTATGSIYVTGVIVNSGTASTILIGQGIAAVAPTTTDIRINRLFLGANDSKPIPLGTPIQIPASRNVLVTAVGGSTHSAMATFYVAP